MGEGAACPSCGAEGHVRPDIVWFGEMPYAMEHIDAALQGAHLFVSIGTSGAVYPAAGFVQTARYCSARTLEINLEPSFGSYMFDDSRTGRAGELAAQLPSSGLTRALVAAAERGATDQLLPRFAWEPRAPTRDSVCARGRAESAGQSNERSLGNSPPESNGVSIQTMSRIRARGRKRA